MLPARKTTPLSELGLGADCGSYGGERSDEVFACLQRAFAACEPAFSRVFHLGTGDCGVGARRRDPGFIAIVPRRDRTCRIIEIDTSDGITAVRSCKGLGIGRTDRRRLAFDCEAVPQ
jgi:hypothetical protein